MTFATLELLGIIKTDHHITHSSKKEEGKKKKKKNRFCDFERRNPTTLIITRTIL